MVTPVAETVADIIAKQKADIERFKRALKKVKLQKIGSTYRPNPDQPTLFMGQDEDLAADDLNISCGITPTYPLEYFMANGFKKPKLTLPKALPDIKSASIGLKQLIYSSSPLTIFDVKIFLSTVMSKMEETCSDNWCGLGVEIAAKDVKVTPLKLFEVEEGAQGQAASGDGLEINEILPALILITGCYRISLIKNDVYKAKIEKLINEQILAAGGPMNNATKCLQYLTPFYSDEEIIKCLAGLDMFLNKFIKNPYARARVGTIVTRYRDCSALLTLSFITDMVGFGAIDFSRWLFVPELSNQYNRIMMCGQDVSNEFSYMPYMTCMKLSEKSPYSATVNSAMHLFAHAIGSAMMLTRSINAAFIPCNNQQGVLENAILFFYAQRKTLGYTPQFYSASEKGEVDKILKRLADISRAVGSTADPSGERETAEGSEGFASPSQIVVELAKEPPTRDGLAWYKWIVEYKCQTPPEITDLVYTRLSSIKTPREGTIGDQLSRTAIAELQTAARNAAAV